MVLRVNQDAPSDHLNTWQLSPVRCGHGPLDARQGRAPAKPEQ